MIDKKVFIVGSLLLLLGCDPSLWKWDDQEWGSQQQPSGNWQYPGVSDYGSVSSIPEELEVIPDPKSVRLEHDSQVRFKTYRCIDSQGTGLEVFRMLIPADWVFEGGVYWLFDNPGMPAVLNFRIRNPSGAEEFRVFPNQPFFWTNNQMTLSMFPPGSKYMGSEVRPPLRAMDALKQIVVPRFLQGASNVKLTRKQELPELARSLGATTPGQFDSAKIRLKYD